MWAIRDPRRSSHFCRLPCKPHIRRELIPTTFPHSGTGELQENGTTLCRRRRSAMPNNGAVPSDLGDSLYSRGKIVVSSGVSDVYQEEEHPRDPHGRWTSGDQTESPAFK